MTDFKYTPLFIVLSTAVEIFFILHKKSDLCTKITFYQ
jgi:hypothetical protein